MHTEFWLENLKGTESIEYISVDGKKYQNEFDETGV
jgi:hypothetical protein